MSKYINMNIPAPRWQGLVAFGMAAVIMLLGTAFSKNELFAWLVSGAFLLLFIVFNNAVSIFSDHYTKYLQESLFVLVGLLFLVAALATLLSGFGIKEAGPYKDMYIIFILAHFSLCALCFLVRSVVDFLLHKDKKRGE